MSTVGVAIAVALVLVILVAVAVATPAAEIVKSFIGAHVLSGSISDTHIDADFSSAGRPFAIARFGSTTLYVRIRSPRACEELPEYDIAGE